MVCCPFHNDRTPSMKVDSRFYCFGCGASGDVIDFSALLHGLGKREAAVRLAEDFGVSYEKSGNAPPDRKRHNRSQPRQKSAEQRFQETERYCFRVLCDYLRLLEIGKQGWVAYKSPERYKKYGSQKGWERVNQDPPEGDGFQEITEEEARQMELPF